MKGARMLGGRVVAGAGMLPSGIVTGAGQTQERNIYKPIRVSPESAQTLQWLTPGNSIKYTIVTNLDWQII